MASSSPKPAPTVKPSDDSKIDNIYKGNFKVGNQKIPKSLAIAGGVLLALGIGYLGYNAVIKKQQQLQVQKPIQDPNISIVNTSSNDNDNPAVNVSLVITPEVIRPNSKIRVKGSFVDHQKNDTTVAVAYWSVFEEFPTGGRRLKGSGIVGNNISKFDFWLSTNNYVASNIPYQLVISDEPIR